MVAKAKTYFTSLITGTSSRPPGDDDFLWGPLLLLGLGCLILLLSSSAFADVTLPSGGADAVGKLKAAGSLLSIVDTALFKWGARIFAGLCIMSAGWALKEQRFGVAIVCVIGAILVGTAPSWVKNIFDISGGDSVFGTSSQLEKPSEDSRYA